MESEKSSETGDLTSGLTLDLKLANFRRSDPDRHPILINNATFSPNRIWGFLCETDPNNPEIGTWDELHGPLPHWMNMTPPGAHVVHCCQQLFFKFIWNKE